VEAFNDKVADSLCHLKNLAGTPPRVAADNVQLFFW
jgi:hypothetical protein